MFICKPVQDALLAIPLGAVELERIGMFKCFYADVEAVWMLSPIPRHGIGNELVPDPTPGDAILIMHVDKEIQPET